MKNCANFLIIAFAMLAASCTGMKERVIELPELTAANTHNLDVRRVELTDSNTVITFAVNYRPKWWITIAPECRIEADGKNYAAVATDGINLGEKLVMPESGECEFTITFEPVPLDTKSIDFTEGTDKGWAIWGIDVSGKKSGNKGFSDSLPKKIRNTDLAGCDPSPVMKAEETVVNFHIPDYKKDYGNKLEVYVNSIGDSYQQTVTLDSLGNGTLSGILYGTSRLNIAIPNMFTTKYVLVAPGEETDIYIDPRISVKEQMARRDSTFAEPEYRYDNGRYAAINNTVDKIDSYGLDIFGSHVQIAPWNSTPDQYTDSVLALRSSKIELINSSDMPDAIKQYASAKLDAGVMLAMCEAPFLLRRSYHYTHENERTVPIDSIKGVPGDEQYARVAEVINFENPFLYMPHYAGYDYAIMFDWNKYKPSVRTDEMRRYVELFNEAKKGKLTDADIEEAGKMSDTFYADALLKRQNAATEDLVKMKNSIQKTPDVANNELFDAITAPHKGKVVVVDLWNTWCGPCRASIKRNEPLKDGELSDEDIVWIYIADESSDTNQYLNLIPNIKGLHYMVSGEQINDIRNRFKVDGIPYYVLVDRKGNAVGHPDFRDPSKFIKGIKTALADK